MKQLFETHLIYGKIFINLSLNELIKLRSVSKAVMFAVDDHLRYQEILTIYDDLAYETYFSEIVKNCFFLDLNLRKILKNRFNFRMEKMDRNHIKRQFLKIFPNIKEFYMFSYWENIYFNEVALKTLFPAWKNLDTLFLISYPNFQKNPFQNNEPGRERSSADKLVEYLRIHTKNLKTLVLIKDEHPRLTNSELLMPIQRLSAPFVKALWNFETDSITDFVLLKTLVMDIPSEYIAFKMILNFKIENFYTPYYFELPKNFQTYPLEIAMISNIDLINYIARKSRRTPISISSIGFFFQAVDYHWKEPSHYRELLLALNRLPKLRKVKLTIQNEELLKEILMVSRSLEHIQQIDILYPYVDGDIPYVSQNYESFFPDEMTSVKKVKILTLLPRNTEDFRQIPYEIQIIDISDLVPII